MRLYSLGRYEGVLKRCILDCKLRGQRHLAKELGQYLAEHARESLAQEAPSHLMPIPPSSEGVRFRGYSLPQVMSPFLLGALPDLQLLSENQQSGFKGQKSSSRGLSREERLERQELDEPAVSPSEKAGTLLLLDDVVTTGATLTAAFYTARSLGWSRIIGLVLAKA